MRLTEVSLNRPVTVLMIVTAVVLFGAVSYENLPVDLLPDFQYPIVTITTEYPGASAEEVDKLVTEPLTTGITSVQGIKRIKSASHEELSEITAQFHWGTDIDFATLSIREMTDKVRYGFPKEVSPPVILPVNPASRPVMTLGVTGDADLYRVKEACERIIKPRMEQLEGVASAEVHGGGRKEIRVRLKPAMVALYDINVSDLNSFIESYNRKYEGGTIKRGDYRYSISVVNELQGVEDLRQLKFRIKSNLLVPLSDIAVIKEEILDPISASRYNGKEIVSVDIYKEYGRNTVQVCEGAVAAVEQLREEYKDLKIHILNRQSEFIKGAVGSLVMSLFYGALLAIVILFLFINDFRSSIAISVSIPVSIIGTFTALYLAGVSVNLMTLGGLALGVGMLVDNSIISLENIFRKRDEGDKPKEAAYTGAREIGTAITASTFTTIAVFLPIIYVKGVAAALFRDQALAVTFSLLFSLISALTVLPLMTYKLMAKGGKKKRSTAGGYTLKKLVKRYTNWLQLFSRDRWKDHLKILKNAGWWHIHKLIIFAVTAVLFILSEIVKLPVMLLIFLMEIVADIFIQTLLHPLRYVFSFFRRGAGRLGDRFADLFSNVQSIYERYEKKALERKSTFLTFFAVLLLVAFLLGATLERKLIPETETGILNIDCSYPEGFTYDMLASKAAEYERALLALPSVDSVYTLRGKIKGDTEVGSAGMSNVRYKVQLKPGVEYSEFLKAARLHTAQEREMEINREYSILEQLILTISKPFSVKVLAPETGHALIWAKKLRNLMAKSEFFIAPTITNYHTMDILEGSLNYDFINTNGLNISSIMDFLTNRLEGSVPVVIKNEGRSLNIRTRIGMENEVNYNSLEGIFYIDPSTGRKFPIDSLIDLTPSSDVSSIYRENNKPYVEIGSNLAGSIEEAYEEVKRFMREMRPPESVQIDVGGEYAEMQESFSSLYLALLLSVFLVYMIISAQFESIKNPLIIILALPQGLIGAVLVLFIFGLSINIITIIGFIVLTGIIVNDAIVKVDRINQLVKEGKSVRDAVMTAGKQRLRPILMTTVTTVFGLLPMAVISAEGSELYSPLALVIIGGLSTATLLTIFFVPVMYELLNRKKKGRAKAK